MKGSKTVAPAPAMPPAATSTAPKSAPKQAGVSRIRNLGEFAHPAKKGKKK